MTNTPSQAARPSGVTVVAVVFLAAAIYLFLTGGLLLIVPGAISLTAAGPLLNGLELAGPYMFWLAAAAGGLIAWGLAKLNRWARRFAIIVALLGMVMLIPTVSAAASDFRPALLWSGLGFVIRMAIVWYLYQSPVAEAFRSR